MSQYTVITDGYGSFGSTSFVITDGYSSAVIATGKQGIFGREDGMNSTIFGGMVMR